MADESRQLLTSPHVQATLLAEAVQTAEVGFLVWDDDRHYIAANAAACALRGCTLEYLTFATRTAGMPHMASVIWRAEEDVSR